MTQPTVMNVQATKVIEPWVMGQRHKRGSFVDLKSTWCECQLFLLCSSLPTCSQLQSTSNPVHEVSRDIRLQSCWTLMARGQPRKPRQVRLTQRQTCSTAAGSTEVHTVLPNGALQTRFVVDLAGMYHHLNVPLWCFRGLCKCWLYRDLFTGSVIWDRVHPPPQEQWSTKLGLGPSNQPGTPNDWSGWCSYIHPSCPNNAYWTSRPCSWTTPGFKCGDTYTSTWPGL